MVKVPYQIEKIIRVANELASHGTTGGSTGEIIAAAFALNRMEFLPEGYRVYEAWERISELQPIVKIVVSQYHYKLVPW